MTWLKFDWTEDDEKALSNDSSEYGQLQARISDLEDRNQGHPMWPEVREQFSQIQNDARMKEIHEQAGSVAHKN